MTTTGASMPWRRACEGSALLRFLDWNLRGIGQVLFQDNALSGLLFLVAIGWGAVALGVPEVAVGGLLAVLVATLTARWLRVDAAGLAAGLYGYNAFLLGIALPTFLAASPLLWVFVVLGALVSVIATRALAEALKPLGIPVLTAPFVLVTLMLLLASNAFSGVDAAALPDVGFMAPIPPEAADPLRPLAFLEGVAHSLSQVFVKGYVPSGLLILAGLAVGSRRAAGLALAGALIALLVAHLMGAESQLVTAGLVGFNPLLTAVALGAVFQRPGVRTAIYALLATVLTVLAQGAMVALITPFGVPTLTASFVLVTWLFLLARLDSSTRSGPAS
ncbi:MAG: urea transporter [Thiohalocapsa sp.]|jgi:urea transporter|uniref:urea transporter n=1 Tax=Thiohalocapsa sp. TaxID=2497641 RepID=UPI0025DC9851|nr:urea transporter [Thiohalocapsa sp.]MCG6942630.1 urea transporter [Thiohalocapsa sp.]